MPTSYRRYNRRIKGLLRNRFPITTIVLDVGPGMGKYARLLDGYAVDCLEVWEPYVERFSLRRKYRKTMTGDVIDFHHFSDYDLVILGDVLEHLSSIDGQDVVERIVAAGCALFVAVPFKSQQGSVHGNIYETHLQSDLTPEVMFRRYPRLFCVYKDRKYGLYLGPEDKVTK